MGITCHIIHGMLQPLQTDSKVPCVSRVLCFMQAVSSKQQFFVFHDSFEASYQSIIEEIVCKKSCIRNGTRDTHAITTIANILQSSVNVLMCNTVFMKKFSSCLVS